MDFDDYRTVTRTVVLSLFPHSKTTRLIWCFVIRAGLNPRRDLSSTFELFFLKTLKVHRVSLSGSASFPHPLMTKTYVATLKRV